jgi:hypothetical protein
MTPVIDGRNAVLHHVIDTYFIPCMKEMFAKMGLIVDITVQDLPRAADLAMIKTVVTFNVRPR